VDDVARRLRDLVFQFFQAKLCLQPRSVEILEEGGSLAVKVRGFSPPAERTMIDHPKDVSDLENYYLRVFDQLPPLLNAGIGGTGLRVKVQTLLDLRGEECVFLLTLARQDGVIRAASS